MITNYTIKQSDIGKGEHSPVRVGNEKIYPFEPLGRVLEQDVGKMCRKVGGIWYVENEEQFERRTKG